MKATLKRYMVIFICAVLTCVFFEFKVKSGGISLLLGLGDVTKSTLIFIAVLYIYFKIARLWSRRKERYKIGYWGLVIIVSAFISAACILGKLYGAKIDGGIQSLLKSGYSNVAKLGLCFIGGWILFVLVIVSLGQLRSEKIPVPAQVDRILKRIESFFFGKRGSIKQLILISLCWLPHVVIRYPGVMVKDGWREMWQYYGYGPYTSQHPMIYIQMLGRFMDLGIKWGDASYGLFLLIIIQTAMTVLVVVYSLKVMGELGLPDRWRLFTLVFYIIIPAMIAYATTAITDCQFSMAFILLMSEMAFYLFKTDQYKRSWRHIVLTILAVLGTFYRYNGVYIVAAILFMVVIREGYRLFKKKQSIRFAALIILALFIPLCFGKYETEHLKQKYNVEELSGELSSRAMCTIPIQQIGRYMTYYSDDITDEEFADLQKVMKWEKEQYKEKYHPLTFDYLKNGFNPNVTREELRGFFRVWLTLFRRHPAICISATANQTYYLFSPLASNQRYYRDVNMEVLRLSEVFVGFCGEAECLKDLQQKLFDYYKSFGKIPILGLIVNQGVYSLLLFAVCIYGLCEKNKKILFLCVPFLLILLITFVGPAVHLHPRYTYPIMYTMPLLLGVFFFKGKSETGKQRREILS